FEPLFIRIKAVFFFQQFSRRIGEKPHALIAPDSQGGQQQGSKGQTRNANHHGLATPNQNGRLPRTIIPMVRRPAPRLSLLIYSDPRQTRSTPKPQRRSAPRPWGTWRLRPNTRFPGTDSSLAFH